MKTLTMDSDLSYIILIASWLVEGTGYEYPGCQRLFKGGFRVLGPTAEDVSAFAQHRKFPPHARKTSGTQGRYERWQTPNRDTKMLQPLGDCLVLLDLPPIGISVALREGGWWERGEGGGVWIISGTIHIFLLSEQNGWLTAERLSAWPV